MIKSSTTYKLTNSEGIIIAEGSARKIRRLHKSIGYGKGYKVWNSPSTNVGDKISKR